MDEILKKYIEFSDYEEEINWASGVRKGGQLKGLILSEFPYYVSIWVEGEAKHTLYGTNQKAIMIRCYNEFMKGERNNIEEYYE